MKSKISKNYQSKTGYRLPKMAVDGELNKSRVVTTPDYDVFPHIQSTGTSGVDWRGWPLKEEPTEERKTLRKQLVLRMYSELCSINLPLHEKKLRNGK